LVPRKGRRRWGKWSHGFFTKEPNGEGNIGVSDFAGLLSVGHRGKGGEEIGGASI